MAKGAKRTELARILQLRLAALVLEAGAAADDHRHMRLALGDVVRVLVVLGALVCGVWGGLVLWLGLLLVVLWLLWSVLWL